MEAQHKYNVKKYPYEANYPNDAYTGQQAEYPFWLIRFRDTSADDSAQGAKAWPDVDHEPDYRRGMIEVNLHPPFEARFWICLKCSNDFQTVTTMPF